ncbi:MAG: NusG domain II-containing protein [Oscillospiraceae bacterium]|nr:NusG domain II-containing protein [Oscillospiraceae bacterium]
MIKTRTWIIILAAAALLAAAGAWLTLLPHGEGKVVEVVQDGTVLREIDLTAVTHEYTFEVVWKDGGTNVVTVRPGRICVSAADCPDKICVHHGWLTDQAAPIVCLPHRLVIRVKGDTALDAVSQ